MNTRPSQRTEIIQVLRLQVVKTFQNPSRLIAIPWYSAPGRFIVRQISKTIQNPVRLIAIPWHWLRRKLSVWPVFAIIFGALIKLIPARFRIPAEQRYYLKGAELLDGNYPSAAWRYFRKCLETSKDPHHFFLAAVCLIVGLGRFKEALPLLTRSNALRAEQANILKVSNSRIRYLEPIWIAAFGHLAQLQYVVKLNILENRRPEDTILYLPPEERVVNPFLLDQWRPFLNIIDKKSELPLPLDTLRALTFDFYAPRLSDNSTVYYWEAADRVNRQWRAEKRGPLLTLPPETEQRGRAALASIGMPLNAWFVALHVREAGFKKHHADLHNVLNADIQDYLAAIVEITKRGGWVVRLGDPSMTPLPPLKNVFDYSQSSLRSDWMDIILLAKCRFFLGTSSGPTYVPAAYGVPSVLTNWWPYAQRPWDEQSIFMPKLYRKLRNRVPLTLSQALTEPFGYCNSMERLRKREGVTVENNTPEDIRDAVIEMIERLDGTARYTSADIALLEKTQRIFEIGDAYGTGTLARDYIRRNETIVD